MRKRFAIAASLAGLALMCTSTAALGTSFASSTPSAAPTGTLPPTVGQVSIGTPLRVARPVALTDARVSPDTLARIPAHSERTYPASAQCGDGYWTEYSAYTRTGGALGGQQWNEDNTLSWWRAPHGRVTFDGITFRNKTNRTVLVGGWCG
jgi:hypothetical protein